jgi:hypothetical protein
MKTMTLFAFLLVRIASADSATDRSEIERVVRTVLASGKSDEKAVGTFFMPDADNELRKVAELYGRLGEAAQAPWSELSGPYVVIQSVRFVTSDIALVDATKGQIGAVALDRRIPILFIMKRDGPNWLIFSLRVSTDLKTVVPTH